MKTIPRISRAQEDHLMQTLNDVASYMTDDMSAKDALVKAAKEAELPRGHIELLVRAFNTGQALDQQAHTDYQQKSAAYEIVDADTVIREVFPPVVKTAAAKTAADYSEYENLPDWLLDDSSQRVDKTYVKSAGDFLHVQKIPESTRARRAQRECDQEQRQLQLLQVEVEALEKKANATVATLTEYFGPYGSVPGRIPAYAVKENSELLWGPFAGTIVKIASRQIIPGRFRHIHPVDTTKTPYAEILSLTELLPALAEKRAAYQLLAEKHQQRIDDDPILFTNWSRTKQASPGVGRGQVAGLLLAKDWAESLANQMRTDVDDTAVAKYVNAIGTPEHETRLRDIQAQAMLQDLFSNDPILGGHDPRDLADTYNSLSVLAPAAMQNPELVRGIMRKRMEAGALEPFELQQLSALNSAMPMATPKLPERPPQPAK